MVLLNRLKEVLKKKIGDSKFVVLSHSEPFVHYYEEGEVKSRKASGGLVAALDPVMSECGGTWIACGSSEADFEVVDNDSVIKVPANDPKYSLKRVRLSKEDISEYLDGVSHSSLWPWCHFAYIRPAFKEARWPAYVRVNKAFADAALEVIGDEKAFVWIHDYHLSLAAKYIKEKRPDIVTAHFWHIPWPNAEIFKICPYGKEIVESLLYNNLIGFQIRYYANNFLDSVDQTLQARVDRELSTIFYKDQQTLVKEFAISIDYNSIRKDAEAVAEQKIRFLKKHLGITAEKIGIGVDRLDYNKGLPEKIGAVEAFLKNNPEWVGKFSLVQVASPTRLHVPAYGEHIEHVSSLVDDVNYEWSRGKWKPIVFLNSFVSHEDVVALYKMADVCLVTSLHDGMNLVSKEYVTANDGNGVLVLSKLTGTSRELTQALLVNPYSISEMAGAIKQALEMPPEEKKARLAKMAQHIEENDVYKWAADFVENIAKLDNVVK